MKRQQTVLLKQQEKERRKQHLMMIRALESQREAEVCLVISFRFSEKVTVHIMKVWEKKTKDEIALALRTLS